MFVRIRSATRPSFFLKLLLLLPIATCLQPLRQASNLLEPHSIMIMSNTKDDTPTSSLSLQPSSSSGSSSILSRPFSTTWRKALISIPRLVPDVILKYTSPEGPHPFVIEVDSREDERGGKKGKKRKIPVYVFVPEGVDGKLPVVVDFHGGG